MTQVFAHEVAPQAPVDRSDAPGAREAGEAPPDEPREPVEGAGVPEHSPLPLVALVLALAGVVLGVTVIWFFAAIPIGVVSVTIGIVARRRASSGTDPRAAPRATLATALGCVAILLGVTGAYFLPRVMDRADRFLGSIQQDVNNDVDLVNQGLSRDVNRLDRTLSRDLRRFERDNHRDLQQLEDRTAATMKALEDRLHNDVDASRAAARRDLNTLESSLQADLRAAQDDLRTADSAMRDTLGALEARIERIEQELGL